jgi:hypothetical protein
MIWCRNVNVFFSTIRINVYVMMTFILIIICFCIEGKRAAVLPYQSIYYIIYTLSFLYLHSLSLFTANYWIINWVENLISLSFFNNFVPEWAWAFPWDKFDFDEGQKQKHSKIDSINDKTQGNVMKYVVCKY